MSNIISDFLLIFQIYILKPCTAIIQNSSKFDKEFSGSVRKNTTSTAYWGSFHSIFARFSPVMSGLPQAIIAKAFKHKLNNCREIEQRCLTPLENRILPFNKYCSHRFLISCVDLDH